MRVLKWLFTSIMIIAGVGFLSLFLPIKIKDVELKEIYKHYYTELVNYLPYNFVLNRPDITASYFLEEDDIYYLNLKLTNISIDELDGVYLSNKLYDVFNVKEENNYLLISFPVEVTFNSEDYNVYQISSLIIRGKPVTFNTKVYVYKSIDNNIINLKKQSVVGIYTPRSRTWGSGVVVKQITTTNLLGQTVYQYFILTNYHVVKDDKGSNRFEIIYKTMGQKITKNVELVATKFDNVDLALLKVTLTKPLLVALDDPQLETYVPISFNVHEPVFAIGSPSNGKSYDFNQVKIGYITNLDVTVTLKDDKTICPGGCKALQTSAIQGKGSSGGGVFDRNGNLIGLHFAGNDQIEVSSEIPISAILEFLENYFNSLITSQIKKGEFSPFILLDNQLLQLL